MSSALSSRFCRVRRLTRCTSQGSSVAMGLKEARKGGATLACLALRGMAKMGWVRCSEATWERRDG